jgi:hypothetical protein
VRTRPLVLVIDDSDDTRLLKSVGVWLHLSERHAHEHVHEPLAHDHLHRHDVHYDHAHEPGCR